jgi:RNA polymerase sigma factor (sigma-70 family)
MTRDVIDLDVEASVHAIYDAQFGRLVGWTTKLVGDPDLAHDFATEAFVKLLRYWSSVREPRAWLYVTVANLVRDHWRKRGREATAYERHEAGDRQNATLSDGDLATNLTVRDAVMALPDRLRMPVLLHYFADLPVTQVANHLGKSEGTIKRDLHDARAIMAGRLEATR